ncbi:MAG: GAF domain-containing protein [Candidatus Omnitrophica bacterium]|nr:GAF domain-containing protein [Candidatus Omnitrophota bacterium]
MNPSLLGKEKVSDSTAAFHTFSDEENLLEFALDSLLALTSAAAGSIFLWDDSSKELVLSIARGPYLDKVSGARVKLKEGVSGWIADKGLSVLVKDIHHDERFKEIKRYRTYQTPSFISVPLLAGNKLVGVINVTERENLISFDEEDFDRANTIAKHVALALENLKTKKRLRKENEELHQSVANLNESLRQQESLVSIGKLAANLAHELNNPLDAIRRFINLALDQVMEDTLAREYLLKAKSGIRRAIQIIRGMLTFARESAKQTTRIAELHTLIEQAITAASQDQTYDGMRFEKEFCEGRVLVKDTGLWTVFKNLFENAHHAMSGRGTIVVATHRNAKQVVISVRDTGCGVPNELKGKVFEPFFSTKERGEGTGIGLAICRDIVDRSGGEITLESTENEGTTFYIMLPYEDGIEKL